MISQPMPARTSATARYTTSTPTTLGTQRSTNPAIGAIVVIGGTRSANTRHLWEICARYKPSHLIQGAADLDPTWFDGVDAVGLTAGASTPDYVVDEVEAALAALRPTAPTSA